MTPPGKIPTSGNRTPDLPLSRRTPQPLGQRGGQFYELSRSVRSGRSKVLPHLTTVCRRRANQFKRRPQIAWAPGWVATEVPSAKSLVWFGQCEVTGMIWSVRSHWYDLVSAKSLVWFGRCEITGMIWSVRSHWYDLVSAKSLVWFGQCEVTGMIWSVRSQWYDLVSAKSLVWFGQCEVTGMIWSVRSHWYDLVGAKSLVWFGRCEVTGMIWSVWSHWYDLVGIWTSASLHLRLTPWPPSCWRGVGVTPGKHTPPTALCGNRLVGPVVKASASRAADPRFDSRLRHGDFSWSSHASDLNIGTPVATLSGAWRYRVGAGTGRPGVSILGLGEMESWIYKILSQCGST